MITPSRLGSLHVVVEVELDARLHGEEIASYENSGEQARLFAGMAVGFEELGIVGGGMQLAYLAESISLLAPEDRIRIEAMLTTLTEHLSSRLYLLTRESVYAAGYEDGR